MTAQGKPTREKVVFLFTTFPVATETFLQREISAFQESGLNFHIVSLWGGKRHWNGLQIDRRGLLTALGGILWIPYYLVKRPAVFWRFLKAVLLPRSSGLLNWGENLLGAGYALWSASHWRKQKVTHFHAVWASAPAMAAWFLSELTDIPFSFAGHAYDLFEHGGDGWIREKIDAASWIRTSTEMGRQRLIELGAREDQVMVVRRGLTKTPPPLKHKHFQPPYTFISVGRMVEKMGFDQQVPLFLSFLETGLSFRVEWIGDGPERAALEAAVIDNQLEKVINFNGALPYDKVEEFYQQADFFVFTGRIDRRGDRAGLPNAIAESMAWGLPVFATNTGAVKEAITHLETGILWEDTPNPGDVHNLLQDHALINRLRTQARLWVESEFNIENNLRPLLQQLCDVTFSGDHG